ncbi:unnamed protein product [Sphagnum balticum]
MNAYTIIDDTPRVILPVNMIALDNLRGTIVSLDRFYHVEAKNGPPHLHHIVTDRVGRTHDLCSARYVERESYHVNSYNSHQDSRGKIVATEDVVPFPEEGTQRYEDLSSNDPDPLRYPLRRRPSVLAKIGGTIKSKVRSISVPVPGGSSKKGVESSTSITERPLNLTHSSQAMSTNSITPPPQFTPTQSRRATATRLVTSPLQHNLDQSRRAIPRHVATLPLQLSLDQSAQERDTSAVTATPPQHTLNESPQEIAATHAEPDEDDGDPYLTPVSTTESFSPLPSPVSASTPRSQRNLNLERIICLWLLMETRVEMKSQIWMIASSEHGWISLPYSWMMMKKDCNAGHFILNCILDEYDDFGEKTLDCGH